MNCPKCGCEMILEQSNDLDIQEFGTLGVWVCMNDDCNHVEPDLCSKLDKSFQNV